MGLIARVREWASRWSPRRAAPDAVRAWAYDDLLTRSGERELRLRPGDTARDAARAAGLGWPAAVVVTSDSLEAVGPGRVLRAGDVVVVAPLLGDPLTAVAAIISIVATAASILLAPKPPKFDLGDTDRKNIFDRVARPAVAGEPAPVQIGVRTRAGGRIVRVREFNNARGESVIRALILESVGRVEALGNQTDDFDRLPAGPGGFEGLYINGQPAENFDGVLVWGRMGTSGQTAIPGFGDTETTEPVGAGGATLRNTSGSERTGSSAGAEAELFSTTGGVNGVRLRFRFARGLFKLQGSGRPRLHEVKYRWRKRVVSGPGFVDDWEVVTVERAEQSPFFAELAIDGLDPADGSLQFQIERVSVENADTSFVDEIRWESVVEVVSSDNRYTYADASGGYAMLAVEMTASEQISGDVPPMAVECSGVRVRVKKPTASAGDAEPWEAAEAFSRNPAAVALAVCERTDWAAGVQFGLGRVDLASLFAWWDTCDGLVETFDGSGEMIPRHRFDYTLSDRVEAWDLLVAVCEAGRCRPALVGDTVHFIYDGPQESDVEFFSEGSVAVGGEGGASGPLYTRDAVRGGYAAPNRIVCEFEDGDEGAELNTVAWPDEDEEWFAGGSPEPLREEVVSLTGITNRHRALREAIYRMKTLRLRAVTVEFETVKPLPQMLPGERFGLAWSAPGWSNASGRLLDSSDADELRYFGDAGDLPGGPSYVAVVKYHDGSIGEASVSSVAQDGEVVVLTLGASLPGDPPADADFYVGVSGVASRPFTRETMELADPENLRWRVRGRAYDADVYNDTPGASAPAPVYSSLRGRHVPPGPVQNLTAEVQGIDPDVRIRLSWSQATIDRTATASFTVYRREEGRTGWELHSERVITTAVLITDVDASVNEEFAVVAVSPDGQQLGVTAAATVTAVVTTPGSTVEMPVDAPASASLDSNGDGTHTLTVEREPNASGYQVELLEGNQSAIGDDHIHAFIAASYPQPASGDLVVDDLRLVVGEGVQMLTRAVTTSGRPSLGYAYALGFGVAPTGESLEASHVVDLSTIGTGGGDDEGFTNASWNGTESRVEATDPAAGAQLVTDELALAVSPTALTIRAHAFAEQLPEDLAIEDAGFAASVVEADAWRVGDASAASGELRLFAPPRPVASVELRVYVRTYDDGGAAWRDWRLVNPFTEFAETTTKAQVRVEWSRTRSPYALAIRRVALTATA